jgi:predicted aconitase
MIALDPIDEALLGGEHGAAAARAMAVLVRYGQALKAERFVSIASAHVDGCLYHGPSSLDFVRLFVALAGRVRVPTTLNVAAVDVIHPEWHCGPPELVSFQRELTALHEALGCLPTLTCAPYQRLVRPRAGEHVAWAESNAIVFANSVLGARTDRYGDFTDLCAALTGRVPLAGFHLDRARRPERVFAVAGSSLPRDLRFAATGYVVGQRAPGQVPLLLGLPNDASEDELKALGAAGASSGAMALFHAAGITPEARWAEDESRGLQVERIEAGALDEALARLCPAEPGEPVAALCLGTPHFSLSEFQRLAAAVVGRSPAPGVVAFVSTSREIAALVEADPAFAPVRDFGIRIVVDTCTYLAPVVASSEGLIVTNSAKYAHYAPGNLRRRVALMSLDRCLASAETGRVVPSC